MALLSPATLLSELKTAITAAVVPAGLTDAGDPIFEAEAVGIFEMDDFGEALERLLLTQDRVCVIVLESMPLPATVEGNEAAIRQQATLSLMFADRNWSNRAEAILGGAENPGVLGLISGVVESACGTLASGWTVLPGDEPGRLILLTGAEGDDHYSRAVFRQPIGALGGVLRVGLGRGTRKR